MKKNLFLIGFMGCGKSTIAALLAEELQMKLVEMDEQIEQEAGMSIADIFEQYGEADFRERETALLHRIRQEGNCVVSCGGGVPMRVENVQAMRAGGRIIYLKTSPQVIYERVKDTTNRPLLNDHMNVEYIATLMEQRKPKYEEAADLTIVTDQKTVAEVCKEMVDKLN